MKVRVVLTVVVLAVLAFVASSLTASADASSFCKGTDYFQVVNHPETLSDPQCGAGQYVITSDEWGKESFDSFVSAEEFRAGRNTTYWFVPAEAEIAPAVEASVVSEAEATATPTVVPTSESQPEVTVTQANDRVARLISLDQVYRSQGWEAWLAVAGAECQAGVEARQPEEETVIDPAGVTHVVVSGLQLRGSCDVPYPAIVTTDRPNEVVLGANSRTFQPDLRNPSVLYTNVRLNGQGTLWIDGTNWGQLSPDGAVEATEAPTVSPVDEDVAGEVSWLRQMLELIQMRLNQLLRPSG